MITRGLAECTSDSPPLGDGTVRATLIRHPARECTLGVIVLDNGRAFQTLELPWLDNVYDISCIPEGEYTVIPHSSPSKGECFALLDVPMRKDILIHAGNLTKDTHGCILVGLEREGESIRQSRAALAELMKQAPDGFGLRILYEGD